MRVLIVEDDPTLAANLGEYLEEQGDEPDYASDGRIGLQLCATESYDALILDLRLPRLDGISLCRRLRQEQGVNTPILMLTARDTVEDRIEGFEAGTDDYLVKPFSLRELYLRLSAIVRRHQPVGAGPLTVGALSLDVDSHVVRYRDRPIELTPIGFAMLEMLMRASPGLVSRADFEAKIWNGEPPESDAALRGHVHRLRELLEAAAEQPVIHTVHGVGYRLLETT
ncbi:response regulator transcription factor [Salinisphaera hydrothermalis]|uniref:Two component transcriptional regulator n=1 Tax=Salinisphaera hydrothermalis (strain C41B8) TaxID=1304275 RepID=A0A084IMS2_SALHC|nr:response regulator transcription factor [Salinisphaera hydrothermalis]KEZ78006.1 two component transcriptional regulator [Salinisphaera hydrothermalis C41B8]